MASRISRANRKKNPGPLVTSPRVVWQNSRAAEVYESGPEFDFVAEALWSQEGRQYPVNAVVKVTIEQALPVLSPVYMFNDKVSEEEVRAIWLKRYGVAARSAHDVDQDM